LPAISFRSGQRSSCARISRGQHVKAKEVRNMNDEQLVDRVGEFREELFNLRFQNSSGELENTARMREAKRSLARALTIARERGLDVEAELRV
jgi:large subunit ribosomal protein L29